MPSDTRWGGLHCRDGPILPKSIQIAPCPQVCSTLLCTASVFLWLFSYALRCLNTPHRGLGVSWGCLSPPAPCPQQKGHAWSPELGAPWLCGRRLFGCGATETPSPATPAVPVWALRIPEVPTWTFQRGCGVSVCSPYLNNAFSFGSPCRELSAGWQRGVSPFRRHHDFLCHQRFSSRSHLHRCCSRAERTCLGRPLSLLTTAQIASVTAFPLPSNPPAPSQGDFKRGLSLLPPWVKSQLYPEVHGGGWDEPSCTRSTGVPGDRNPPSPRDQRRVSKERTRAAARQAEKPQPHLSS